MKRKLILLCLFNLILYACGGGSSNNTSAGPTRTFMMGATPFFATPSRFPDWRFDHLNDKDLLSIHVDDFWGVPWVEFRDNIPLPAAWVTQWATFARDATTTGKPLYLALSPLGNRKTLAPRVNTDGTTQANWAPVDANGCYTFTDAAAAGYRQAYINYVSYLINLVQPAYVSPAIEMNIPFTQCPTQKAAWIAWYTDAHKALKVAHPNLVLFPTFQMEHMYGIADAQSACGGVTTTAACFDLRLTEALTIPGDRIAFSTYPISWKYRSDYQFSYPTDTYSRVASTTGKKIWIAETGWAAVKILQSYEHPNTSICGTDLFPASFANDTELGNYLSWLLTEAQNRKMETVIWWLNQDYLDGKIAATCVCTPTTSNTCQLAEAFYTHGGATGELLLRLFGNMALRNYDGSGRPALSTWQDYINRRLIP